MCPGLTSAQVVGRNLLTLRVMKKLSITLLLILFVTLRYRISKMILRMLMSRMFIENAIIANDWST